MTQHRILCISLSPIARDARVLRQISVLAEFGPVTTIGYGPKPAGASEHIEVPAHLTSLPQDPWGVLLLATRQFERAEAHAPAARFILQALRDRSFDVVVANEARVLAVADQISRGAPIWVDLHEWAPEERTHVLSWRLLVAPLMRYLCARYLPSCAAATTVSPSIAALYQQDFGVLPRVVRNTNPWRDLSPSPVADDHIRLVHSGGAVRGRNLEALIDSVAQLDTRFSLDLYLVPANDGGRYLRELTTRAHGIDRIRFHDPVDPSELPGVLNSYDVGVYVMPPITVNARLALPNKFFDFVQGRLGVVVGPTKEMSDLVQEHGLGEIAAGFSVDATVAALSGLTADAIRAYKVNSDLASKELSFDADAVVIREILRELTTES